MKKKRIMTAVLTQKQIKIHVFKYSFHLSLSQYRTNLSGTRNFFADYNSLMCTDHGKMCFVIEHCNCTHLHDFPDIFVIAFKFITIICQSIHCTIISINSLVLLYKSDISSCNLLDNKIQFIQVFIFCNYNCMV